MPASTVIPVLAYPSVPEAVAWLTAAFGFVERTRIGDSHRSQMSIGGDGAMIVAEAGREQRRPATGSASHVIKVRVEDVDALFERARSHGATVVQAPTGR